MEPAIPFVMILALGGQTFIGQDDFPDQAACERRAPFITMNIQAQAKCIPNAKEVQERMPFHDGPPPRHFDFDPEDGK